MITATTTTRRTASRITTRAETGPFRRGAVETTATELTASELTLGPVGLDEFLAKSWDREPLRIPRKEPGRFDSILSRADVERLLCETAIRSPAFRLVRDGVRLTEGDYSTDIPWRPRSFSGVAEVDRVGEEFQQGATIVLQALHIVWHAAAVYCRNLEAALGCAVQANAYLTPTASQGFGVHHDTHDVFVLQVAGSKRWRWYAPVQELPLNDQRWSSELHAAGEAVKDFVLEPGDTLYLPRGWPHEASTSDADSLHLTVGVHPPRRIDALRSALDSCGDDVEFRRALGADGRLPDHLLERLAAKLEPDEVARRARRQFLSTRRPVLDSQLAYISSLDRLTVTDEIARRTTVIADLEIDPEVGITLTFEGREIDFPWVARTALEAVYAADTPFRASDLPGPLDDVGRLVLIRRLVREGFLHPVRAR